MFSSCLVGSSQLWVPHRGFGGGWGGTTSIHCGFGSLPRAEGHSTTAVERDHPGAPFDHGDKPPFGMVHIDTSIYSDAASKSSLARSKSSLACFGPTVMSVGARSKCPCRAG